VTQTPYPNKSITACNNEGLAHEVLRPSHTTRYRSAPTATATA